MAHSLVAVFCSPKAFTGVNAWNQLNALRSWRAMGDDIELIIFGAPEGAAQAAAEVNAILVPEIETSPSGAPSFNAMVAWAMQHSRHDLLVYANCDILLNATLLSAMQSARRRFERFLLVGERMDLAEGVRLDARQQNWISQLPTLFQQGHLTAHGPTGADYFGFVRGMWQDLPPVFMGRGMCDQALLHYCFRQRIPVIDATLVVVNVHQHHDYQHVASGKRQVFHGAEREIMARAHGLCRSLPTIADADWSLMPDGRLVDSGRRDRKLRQVEMRIRYHWQMPRAALIARALAYLQGQNAVRPPPFHVPELLAAWERSGSMA